MCDSEHAPSSASDNLPHMAAGVSIVLDRDTTRAAAGMPLVSCSWQDSVAAWTLAPTLPEVVVFPDAQQDPRYVPPTQPSVCTLLCEARADGT